MSDVKCSRSADHDCNMHLRGVGGQCMPGRGALGQEAVQVLVDPSRQYLSPSDNSTQSRVSRP